MVKPGTIYFCQVCGQNRSQHNKKRHDGKHFLCMVCMTIRGPRHKCLALKKLQWIAVTDGEKITCFVLGIPVPALPNSVNTETKPSPADPVNVCRLVTGPIEAVQSDDKQSQKLAKSDTAYFTNI